MSDIFEQGLYISAAGTGAPADVQFSPQASSPQTFPPHMNIEKVTVRFTRGFDCTTLSPVASCGTYDIIIRRRS